MKPQKYLFWRESETFCRKSKMKNNFMVQKRSVPRSINQRLRSQNSMSIFSLIYMLGGVIEMKFMKPELAD